MTKTIVTRYTRATKPGESEILDELCATTGRHRHPAREALAQALRPTVVRTRAPRPPKYGPEVIAALRFCWAVLDAPPANAWRRSCRSWCRRCGASVNFGIDDVTAELLMAMSAAAIDRRLAPDRRALDLKGRTHTKPGSLLNSQIPIRICAQRDDAVPGFVEIDWSGTRAATLSTSTPTP